MKKTFLNRKMWGKEQGAWGQMAEDRDQRSEVGQATVPAGREPQTYTDKKKNIEHPPAMHSALS